MKDYRLPSYNDFFNRVVAEICFLVLTLDLSFVDSEHRRSRQRKVFKAIL